MSRSNSARLAFSLLIGSAACSGPSSGDDAARDKAAAAAAGLAGSVAGAVAAKPASLDAQALAPSQPVRLRYVALMNAGAPCAPLRGWSAQRLFRFTGPAAEAWGAYEAAGGKMPAPLERFCLYTWTGAGQPLAPPAVPGSVRVDPDPDVVVPQASPTQVLAAARSTALLQGLGATPGAPPSVTPYSREEGLPYVAVVDTADSRGPGPTTLPSYASAPARLQHGLTMAALIQAVRCPHRQAQCTSRQFFAQAFPFDAAHVQPLPSGGERGSLGSLAAALGESMVRWKARPDAGSSPLVINMSLGWDLEHGGALPPSHGDLLDVAAPDPTVPATVQAVHTALAWAACEGALSIAAAGNTEGALCERQGALAPAAWESLPELDATACAHLGVALAGDQSPPKLTYGVGGLDATGQPIANSRLGSMPSRALHAHQATVSVDGGSATTQPWTGTSIAAAGLSAIAAQVWSHRPSNRATDVVGMFDAHGTPIPVASQWRSQTSGNPAAVHRIDAHGVIAAIDAANNPYVSSQASSAISQALRDVVSARLQAPNPLGAVSLVSSKPVQSNCGALPVSTFVAPGTSGTTGLPATSYLRDETRPQPHVPICPNCPVVRKTSSGSGSGSSNNGGSSGTTTTTTATALTTGTVEYALYVELDGYYAGATVDRPVLTFYDSQSGTTVSMALGTISLTTPTQIDLHTFTLPSGETVADWLERHGGVVSGRLTLQVDDDSPSGPNPPQTMNQVVDVVR
ncbi:S8 family serine peptidase [Paraliomyxa miuraensis]|uniref:S8 family serine peptidase n=1 Tax=Paraliomyxa miuraensis TaxID=376150 RepID=UPI002252D49C|nr:S8 family serine peptidase [Paraliomyxa miuraensis]MCX4241256.1 S8 family serine peptidase [Paraliomyxa miuraensis]